MKPAWVLCALGILHSVLSFSLILDICVGRVALKCVSKVSERSGGELHLAAVGCVMYCDLGCVVVVSQMLWHVGR